MPRKGPAPKRPLVDDPVYGSKIVTQLVNRVLLDAVLVARPTRSRLRFAPHVRPPSHCVGSWTSRVSVVRRP